MREASMGLLPRTGDRSFKPSLLSSAFRRAWSSLWPKRGRGPGSTKRSMSSPSRTVALEPLELRLLLAAELSYFDNGNLDTDLTLTYDATDAEYRLITAS